MTLLVSLQQVKSHLRIDTADGDADILAKAKAASAAIVRYLKEPVFWSGSSGVIETDSAGIAIDVPEDVQIATLLLIGYFDRQRDEDEENSYAEGRLPQPVRALLPERVPTIGITDADLARAQSRRRRWGCW